MKRLMGWILALLLMIGCIPAGAETEEEIRFLGIPWGSDMATVCLLLKANGLINEEGVGRFEQTEKRLSMSKTNSRMRMITGRYSHYAEEDGFYIIERGDHGDNVESVTLMSDMVAQLWMGIDVHHIDLVFALDGNTEKLVNVLVSFMVNRDDLRPELEKAFGKPDQVNGDERSVFWQGANRTALLYDGLEINYGLLDAQEIVEASSFGVSE